MKELEAFVGGPGGLAGVSQNGTQNRPDEPPRAARWWRDLQVGDYYNWVSMKELQGKAEAGKPKDLSQLRRE